MSFSITQAILAASLATVEPPPQPAPQQPTIAQLIKVLPKWDSDQNIARPTRLTVKVDPKGKHGVFYKLYYNDIHTISVIACDMADGTPILAYTKDSVMGYSPSNGSVKLLKSIGNVNFAVFCQNDVIKFDYGNEASNVTKLINVDLQSFFDGNAHAIKLSLEQPAVNDGRGRVFVISRVSEQGMLIQARIGGNGKELRFKRLAIYSNPDGVGPAFVVDGYESNAVIPASQFIMPDVRKTGVELSHDTGATDVFAPERIVTIRRAISDKESQKALGLSDDQMRQYKQFDAVAAPALRRVYAQWIEH